MISALAAEAFGTGGFAKEFTLWMGVQKAFLHKGDCARELRVEPLKTQPRPIFMRGSDA
jgi:hypothetical protein